MLSLNQLPQAVHQEEQIEQPGLSLLDCWLLFDAPLCSALLCSAWPHLELKAHRHKYANVISNFIQQIERGFFF